MEAERTFYTIQDSVGAWGAPSRTEESRYCKDCPTRLTSYEGWRERCHPCSRRRSSKEAAVSRLWLKAQQIILSIPEDANAHQKKSKVSAVRKKAIALSVGLLSTDDFAFRGSKLEILGLVPAPEKQLSKKFSRIWSSLVDAGYIREDQDSVFTLVDLPGKEVDDGVYTDILSEEVYRPGDKNLLRIYALANT